MVGQSARQCDGDPGVAGDEGRPAPVSGEAADAVADLVIGNICADCGDDADKVHAQFGFTLIDGGESAHGYQHVREVQAGRRDCDLDLPGPGRNAVEYDQLRGFQVTGGTNTQAHRVFRVVDDGGVSLVGTQWARTQT